MPVLDGPIKWITEGEPFRPFRVGPVDKHSSWKRAWSDIVPRLSWKARPSLALVWMTHHSLHVNGISCCLGYSNSKSFQHNAIYIHQWWHQIWPFYVWKEALMPLSGDPIRVLWSPRCSGLSYNHLIHTYWNQRCGSYNAGTGDTRMNNSVCLLRELRFGWETIRPTCPLYRRGHREPGGPSKANSARIHCSNKQVWLEL